MKVKIWIDPNSYEVYTKENLDKALDTGYDYEINTSLYDIMDGLLCEDTQKVMNMLKPEYAESIMKQAKTAVLEDNFQTSEIEIKVEGVEK